MQRNSTNYVLFFTITMTAIVAVILAGMSTALKDIHKQNEQNYNKKQILSSLNLVEDTKFDKKPDVEVAAIFTNQVKGVVIDANGTVVEGKVAADIDMEKEEKKAESDRLYPVFEYKSGDKTYYILSVRGNGLWDKIWGWIAVENDEDRTVAGVAFGHKGETPGLGAEIKDNNGWKSFFGGRDGVKLRLYENGSYKSIKVVKGAAKDRKFEIDGISGATVTCNGVSEMLERGLAVYMPYLDSIKK